MKWIELQYDEDKPSRIAEYTDDDVGCYFDGAFGFDYNAKRILEFAAEHGFTYSTFVRYEDEPLKGNQVTGLPPATSEELEWLEQRDLDELVWVTDAATDWLNENTLRPPFIEGEREYYLNWAWEDGDFGLWKYDWNGDIL
jgi:hypothetical protein